jgi:hypothetical protein
MNNFKKTVSEKVFLRDSFEEIVTTILFNVSIYIE